MAYVLGVCFVVVGGRVAAATGPLELAQGSWLAAYLVLVCDVVIAGVLLDAAAVVGVGAVPLLVTLGLAIHAARRPARPLSIATVGYLAVLVVRVPVGLVLTHVRGG